MKILAIDTSSKICTVAITENMEKIIELHSDDEKTHSVKLMPMIDEAFRLSHLSLDDIELIACSIGPGSFTGVRIGIATVKAFADAKKIPLVGVSSLEGLCYNTLGNISSLQLPNTLFCSMIDAKNHNVYCGLYRYENDRLTPFMDLMAEDIDVVIDKMNTTLLPFVNQFQQIVFVGDGTFLYQEQLSATIKSFHAHFATIEESMANGVSIATSGYKKFLNGEFGNSNTLSPLYLRKSQAERALDL